MSPDWRREPTSKRAREARGVAPLPSTTSRSKPPTSRVELRLSDDLAAELRSLAQANDRTIAAEARRALVAHIHPENAQRPGVESGTPHPANRPVGLAAMSGNRSPRPATRPLASTGRELCSTCHKVLVWADGKLICPRFGCSGHKPGSAS